MPGAAMADPAEDRFRAAFGQVSASDVVAVAAGFSHRGGAPVVAVRGARFKGSQQLLATDARWHVGSITKSFTATLLARMAERGDVAFDAPLAALVPEYAAELHPDWRSLTLSEILSHTAGLRPNFTIRQMIGAAGNDLTSERLTRLRAHWGKKLPGRRGRFAYSNLGYVLAGLVGETRAGLPWQELIRREIAEPLGLSSLGFGPPRGDADPWGHRRGLFVARPVDPSGRGADNPAWFGPAGTLHMSLGDLLRWGWVHIHACRGEMPDFLSAEACQRLHRPVAGGYALGWALAAFEGLDEPVQSHNGSNTMWVAELAYSAERDMVLALAMNEARLAEAETSMRVLAKALLEPDHKVRKRVSK